MRYEVSLYIEGFLFSRRFNTIELAESAFEVLKNKKDVDVVEIRQIFEHNKAITLKSSEEL